MRFIRDAAINDNGFIFNPFTGDSFMINEMGKVIVDCLKKDYETEQIKNYLFEIYDVEARILERDLSDFIEKLKTYHLIELENKDNSRYEIT